MELWFRQILFDIDNNNVKRATNILHFLSRSFSLFDDLTRESFFNFRPYLGNMSGINSEQYKELKLKIKNINFNDLTEAFKNWQKEHLKIVKKFLKIEDEGTGGTSGILYLEKSN
jgi:tryptophan 2,3-dioxygenase